MWKQALNNQCQGTFIKENKKNKQFPMNQVASTAGVCAFVYSILSGPEIYLIWAIHFHFIRRKREREKIQRKKNCKQLRNIYFCSAVEKINLK